MTDTEADDALQRVDLGDHRRVMAAPYAALPGSRGRLGRVFGWAAPAGAVALVLVLALDRKDFGTFVGSPAASGGAATPALRLAVRREDRPAEDLGLDSLYPWEHVAEPRGAMAPRGAAYAQQMRERESMLLHV